MARVLSTDLARTIQSEYTRANDGVSALELEVRFNDVSREAFHRVVQHFTAKTPGKSVTQTHRIDTMLGTLRRSVPAGGTSVEWQSKMRVWKHDVMEWPIRIALSKERVVSPSEQDIKTFQANIGSALVRDKKRTTFRLFSGTMQLDATQVRQLGGETEGATTYELELELIPPATAGARTPPTDQQLERLDTAVMLMLSLIQDSDIPIPRTEREWINTYIGKLISDRPEKVGPDSIPFDALVQARDLKLRDLVDGGLVGGKTEYSVTVKADGERRLLAFTPLGVYFVLPPHRLNKIASQRIALFEGTVLDGEYIPAANRRGGEPAEKKHVWVGFDCLSEAGNPNIRDKKHFERLEVCKKVTSPDSPVLTLPTAFLMTKAFWLLPNPETFYDRMAALLSSFDLLPYKQDGLMFTPNNAPYKTEGPLEFEMHRRVLTRYTDICKWKPLEQHTIDFGIQYNAASVAAERGPFVFTVVGDNRKRVEWKGTDEYPFEWTVDRVDWTTPLFSLDRPPAPNSIYEFGWDPKRDVFIPYRERLDKTQPNYITIANDVWQNVHDPITKDELLGAGFRQLRLYHNQVKGRVLGMVSPAKLVLDIGSGNGGDLRKWSKFERVIAVEPDATHRAEFERRVKSMGPRLRTRVELFAGTGENALSVIPRDVLGNVDVVTCMLSLTFFFKDEETIEALARTFIGALKPTGRVAFVTMNGDAVRALFDPPPALGHPVAPYIPRWKTPGMRLTYTAGEGVDIHIPNSIVQDQHEWLVDIDRLVTVLNEFDPVSEWSVSVHELLDQVQFLPTDSLVLNKLYSYGILQRKAVAGGRKTVPTKHPTAVASMPEPVFVASPPKKKRSTAVPSAEPEPPAAVVDSSAPKKKARTTVEPTAVVVAGSSPKKKVRATPEPAPPAAEVESPPRKKARATAPTTEPAIEPPAAVVGAANSPKKKTRATAPPAPPTKTFLVWTFEQDSDGNVWMSESSVAPTNPFLFYALLAVSPSFQTESDPSTLYKTMDAVMRDAAALAEQPFVDGPIVPGHPLWNVIWTLLGVNIQNGSTEWTVGDTAFPTLTVDGNRVLVQPTDKGAALLRSTERENEE